MVETQASTENQAQVIKEEIEGLLETSRTIEESVIQASNSIMSFGKSLDDWHRELTIVLDPTADPAKVKMYASQLSNNLDTAYRNLSKAKAIAFSHNLSYNSAFNEKIAAQALSRNRKVAPAMDTMTRVAENQLPERVLVHKRAEMTVEFWESMLWKIKDKINVVNIMSMSNGTLYKVGEFNG